MNYKEFFKDKKITIMGLGLLGGALNDAIFLYEAGANLTITDIKNEIELKPSLDKLKKYKGIKYVLGHHDLADFQNADFILEPGNVPPDSIYIKEAEKNNIPIHTSESLFCEFAKDIKIVGITGTRGKTMTTMLIYEILSKTLKDKNVYLGGNIRNTSTLALLKKVKEDDIVVLELDSWALGALGGIKYSPHISVFTSFMEDHMNYYKGSMEDYFLDKANIFKYQNKSDFLIINPKLNKLIKKDTVKAKLIKGNIKEIANFKFIVPGEHQKMNLALAYKVAKLFDIKDSEIKKVVKEFKGVEGRLEFLKEYNCLKIDWNQWLHLCISGLNERIRNCRTSISIT
jgi:UDP-N-acetylmuramoylalanine--D-glutamate ligase